MFFKHLCLLLVAGCGLASASNAATIVNIEMILRYDGTFYTDGYIRTDAEDYTFFDSFLADDDPRGVPTFDPGMKVGDHTTFRASIVLPESEMMQAHQFDNGGRTQGCQLSHLTCGTVTEVFQLPDGYVLNWGELEGVSFGMQAGQQLTYLFTPEYRGSTLELNWGTIVYANRFANFTILDVTQPAPVPVPMPALLLPAGLGAFAFLRKRRRMIS